MEKEKVKREKKCRGIYEQLIPGIKTTEKEEEILAKPIRNVITTQYISLFYPSFLFNSEKYLVNYFKNNNGWKSPMNYGKISIEISKLKVKQVQEEINEALGREMHLIRWLERTRNSDHEWFSVLPHFSSSPCKKSLQIYNTRKLLLPQNLYLKSFSPS